jgi:guanylate kinase
MISQGNIFIISAPSGSGKTTLVNKLVHEVPGLSFSVSHTTRQRKEEEQDGVDYHFVTPAIFKQMIAEDRFVEHAQLYGDYYGTSREEIQKIQSVGKDVILDIDTNGACQVKTQMPLAVSIFIFPPSLPELERRLRGRKRDSEADIEKRLKWAVDVEIHRYSQYDYVVINDQLKNAFESLKSIILAERARINRMTPAIQSIIQIFGGSIEQ